MLDPFYDVARLGAVRLSDGGGPFGFDISVAYQVDHLVGAYQADALVETGAFLGDTTEYLARRYPMLPVIAIEIDPDYAHVTATRCRDYANVEVHVGDSAVLLPDLTNAYDRPFHYLDAHWGNDWPLGQELRAIQRGVIAIDDFDIGLPRFGYDEYGGVRLDADLVSSLRPDLTWFVGNPYAAYPHPCLQVGRRTGTAFAAASGDSSGFAHDFFAPAGELGRQGMVS